jgi:hypothetical protein
MYGLWRSINTEKLKISHCQFSHLKAKINERILWISHKKLAEKGNQEEKGVERKIKISYQILKPEYIQNLKEAKFLSQHLSSRVEERQSLIVQIQQTLTPSMLQTGYLDQKYQPHVINAF